MAFVAARGLARTTKVACPALTNAPRMVSAPLWRQAAPMGMTGVRNYVTANKYSRDEVLAKLDTFHAEVLSANWADYLYLVYNGPFWEAELERLQTLVQPYLHEKEVGDKFAKTQEMMDVLYCCEDVRDFLNELSEVKTRGSGFMGTGYAPLPKVENMDELAASCAKAYDDLLEKHPVFKPKIEQTVGHGLAVLRSKVKFGFASGHRYGF